MTRLRVTHPQTSIADRLRSGCRAGGSVAVLAPIRLAVAPAGPLVIQAAAVLASLVAIAIVYLVKSALGIDILPGPSPLHGLLYPLLMRG